MGPSILAFITSLYTIALIKSQIPVYLVIRKKEKREKREVVK
jgi:hypothetical protein